MRIWCQIAGASGKDQAWDPYDQSLRRHIQEVVRPGTSVDLHGIDYTIPGISSHFASSLLAQFQIIRNAIRAEEQGCDAFVVLSTNDSGSDEIRELVNIPVVFITEACLHLACLLADRFAFLTHNELMLSKKTKLAERYGLTHRMVPGGHLDIAGHSELMDMYQNPKRYIDPVVRMVREIGSRGANLLIPSSGALSQWLVDNDLLEIDGIAILDSSGAALKMTELMVDLKAIHIERSPKYYSRPKPDVLNGLRKLFGV